MKTSHVLIIAAVYVAIGYYFLQQRGSYTGSLAGWKYVAGWPYYRFIATTVGGSPAVRPPVG